MKKIIVLSSLLIVLASASIRGAYFYAEIPDNKNKSSDILYISDGQGGQKIETYNEYFCSLDKTRQENDTTLVVNVPISLFVQLIVQAWKAPLDKRPLQDLLGKIKNGQIKQEPIIVLTKKDAMHRLLSYIPRGNIYSLVNDKRISLEVLKQFNYVPYKPMPVADARQNRAPSDPAFPTLIPQDTGLQEIVSDYNFEKDPVHNNARFIEFDGLIRNHV